VDAGTVWGDDVAAAAARLPALRHCRVGWLEEPFASGALQAYQKLWPLAAEHCVPLAAGEGAHNVHMARNLIDYGGVDFVQIDAGRIGGISAAKDVADVVSDDNRLKYVNHTFTSHLALSASIQPYAGLRDSVICEYPADPKPLAWELTKEHLTPDTNGEIRLPEGPGLGVTPDPEAIRKYLVETEIVVRGKVLYRTPEI
jgi:L-alanine-DL-glutamate epimerase-like enolase superfamily enzyme